MDRGDTGIVVHEVKDLKTRRAEQEAYRKALEEQIIQKRKIEEQEREKYEGIFADRRTQHGTFSTLCQTPQRNVLPSVTRSCKTHIQPPEAYKSIANNSPSPKANADITCQPQDTPLFGQCRPISKGRNLSFNDTDNFNEPHPVAVAAVMEENSAYDTTATTGIPEFSPACMKYLQQVMPGFTLPSLPPTPPLSMEKNAIQDAIINRTPRLLTPNNEAKATPQEHIQAFSSGSSGTTSESSSVEDVQTPAIARTKIHVSQTSEQLEGVKVSRKQYREELQRQIDERKRREEELRRKAEEEEAKIQEKIRIEQEKMQKEYEEELRKQEEREREAEKKRLATLAKQNEIIRAKEQFQVMKCDATKEHPSHQNEVLKKDLASSESTANPSNSEDSIESIDDFFNETLPQGKKYIDPDDRIIPVIAKKLKEKSIHKEKDRCDNNENPSLTARVESVFSEVSRMHEDDGPPPPQPGITREIAIRSAPCPSTSSFVDLEFLSTLKSYLQNEKSKIDERMLARSSKSSENF